MNIPPQAKRVFQGKIFDVYQWEQTMFDGSYATFERAKRMGTVQIIATQGDKVLVSFESQPDKPNFYTLFGGRMEEGEEPLAAAKREFLEETGMEAKDWELFKVYDPISKIDWKLHYFIARDCHKVAEQKLDAGEKVEVKEYSFEEFLDLVLTDDFRDLGFVNDVLRMKLEPTKLEEFRKKLFGV